MTWLPLKVVLEAPVAIVSPDVVVSCMAAEVIFIFPVAMVVAPTAIVVVPPVMTTPAPETMPIEAHPIAIAPAVTPIAPVSTRILAEVRS